MHLAQLVRKDACRVQTAWARNTASQITVSMQRALAATPSSTAISWCTCFKQRLQAQLQISLLCPQAILPAVVHAVLLLDAGFSWTAAAKKRHWRCRPKYLAQVRDGLLRARTRVCEHKHLQPQKCRIACNCYEKGWRHARLVPPKKKMGLHVDLTTPVKKKQWNTRRHETIPWFIANGPALACHVRTRCARGSRTHPRVHQRRTAAPPAPPAAQRPRAIGAPVSPPCSRRPRKQ